MSDLRSRFTIWDVTVLSVLASLACMLLPLFIACNSVVTGRNAQCKNNLRQLLIALDIFENRKKHYPGWQNEIAGAGTTPVNWIIAILPEIEQLDIYDEWLADPGNEASANVLAFIELLNCPDDPPKVVGGPINSYVGNSGFADDDYADARKSLANGIMHRLGIESNSETMIDGKSYTMFVSENIQATEWVDPSRWATTFVWHAADPPSNPTWRINGNRDTAAPGSRHAARPASYHRGGVNAGFCDTHVIFLSEDVDYQVVAQLMTPDGKNSSMPATWQSQLIPSDFHGVQPPR